MQYEIVALEAKTVVGLKERTSNTDPAMGEKIGKLWQRLYSGVLARIPHQTNQKGIGLYTNYGADLADGYDVLIGCQVDKAGELPAELAVATIPAGRYARFVVHGDVQQAVAECWSAVWQMDLPRAFTADFEEYQPGEDKQNAEIHIYIALK